MAQKILYSREYDKFKFKYGNREVSRRRVEEIKKNIADNGWFCNPIMVNERMEIIDGQHRFSALQDLGLPIEYVVIQGASLKEARMLNSTSRNWGTQNYIDSFAADGDVNYNNFKLLEKKYPRLTMTIIYGVVSGKILKGGANGLKEGRLRLPTDRLDNIYSTLDYIMENWDSIKRIEGREGTICTSIAWVLDHTKVDRKRLSKVLHQSVFPPVSEAAPKRFLESLSREYNKRLRKESQIKFDAIYELSK